MTTVSPGRYRFCPAFRSGTNSDRAEGISSGKTTRYKYAIPENAEYGEPDRLGPQHSQLIPCKFDFHVAHPNFQRQPVRERIIRGLLNSDHTLCKIMFLLVFLLFYPDINQ